MNKILPHELLVIPREVPGGPYRPPRVEPVIRVIAHPPTDLPRDCPIRGGLWAVEARTASGVRWFGCRQAAIGSDLRMHLAGLDPAYEIQRKWEDSPHPFPEA